MTFEDKEYEAEVEKDCEKEATYRLSQPISMSDIMTKCPEFSVVNDEIDLEEDRDMMSVYSYEELEPYILSEHLEVHSDDAEDEDHPIMPFSMYQKKMECVTDDGKVKKLLERCGSGPIVGNKNKCVVYVHYSLYNDHDECPFDSSRLRKKRPESYRLGYDSMIEGMAIAIQTMKKGEKSKFVIEPEYAYKELGVPPRIPPNATVLLDIELIDFTESEDIIARHGKEDDEVQEKRTFQEVLHSSEKLRQHGNKLKNLRKDINGAIRDYRRGIYQLVQFHYTNAQDEELGRKSMLKLYTNLCLCLNSKSAWKQACTAYNNACHDCPKTAQNCPKLLYQSAKALKNLGDYKEAVVRLKKALAIKPDDEEILRELDIATKEKAQNEVREKSMYKNMFGFRKSQTSEEEEKFEKIMNTIDDSFKKHVLSEVKSLTEGVKDSVKFSFGATPVEKEYCQRVCQKNNLTFRVTKTDGVETLIFASKS